VGQRVVEVQTAELLAQGRGQHRALQPVAHHALVHQRGRQHQQAALGVDQRVLERRVQVQRLVGRDRPGGGRPDDGKGVLLQRTEAKGSGQLRGLGALEGDIQRLALLVGVLDLEFGQRTAAVEAPVHRLEAAIDETALDDALERADLARLVGRVHRRVAVLPVAQHAQALEIEHLLRDLFGGVGAALRLHLVAAQAAAVLLLDRVLDRQAVAVPAGDVLGVEAGQLPRLDDHVLEHLVDGVTHVDGAVGIRGAVVQHEERRTVAGVTQALVEAFLVPGLDPARLPLGQVAPHRERGVRKVQGLAIVLGGRGVHGVVAAVGRRIRQHRKEGAGKGRLGWQRLSRASGGRADNSVARRLAAGGHVPTSGRGSDRE
jgi:hypothetical protein